MTYYTIKAAFATVAFPVLLLMLYSRYHTMRYKFDAEGIRMSWGILFRREIMLNYSRIQDIHPGIMKPCAISSTPACAVRVSITAPWNTNRWCVTTN